MTAAHVKLYALSTCSHCRSVKRLLEKEGADFEAVDVDLLEKEERKAVLEEVKQYNERVSFPTTVIGDTVIVGNKGERIRKALAESSSTNRDTSTLSN